MLPSLPHEELQRLLPGMERISLALGQVLYWPDEPITHVYFPVTSVVSLVALAGGGHAVEAGIIGHEGVVGLPVFLGATMTYGRAVCQIPGSAWRLPAEAFRDASGREGPLRDRLLRYTQALFQQVAQSSGCNRAHPVQERCARWLLLVHDRLPGDRFHLTQEYLSMMLGVRRPSVTVVMGALQQAGLLHYHRGEVTVLDRDGLEGAACECYGIIRREADRLLGPVGLVASVVPV